MESNFNIVSFIFDTFECIFLGSCKVQEYEYTFILNDEKIKADYCLSDFYGLSFCEYDDVRYNNVAYESKIINEYKTGIKPFNLIFSFILLFLFLINIFSKIFRN